MPLRFRQFLWGSSGFPQGKYPWCVVILEFLHKRFSLFQFWLQSIPFHHDAGQGALSGDSIDCGKIIARTAFTFHSVGAGSFDPIQTEIAEDSPAQ